MRRRRSLWFVVPVHGRLDLAAVCLRQLRRTCDALDDAGIEASAVLIADRENLDGLEERLGKETLESFAEVERDNLFVSARYNDGVMLACDRRYNPRPADYVVPCGSDDWVDWRILVDLPDGHTIVGFQRIAFVREDGREMSVRHLNYPGGAGIRIYPRRVMQARGFRPCDEDRRRACDTSMMRNLHARLGSRLRVEHREIDPRQLVDWKSPGENLNSYEAVSSYHRADVVYDDPFEALRGFYPAEALDEMAEHYALTVPA